MFGRATKLIKTSEWWSYKIPPVLAAVYAFAWQQHIASEKLWAPISLLILLGIIFGAYARVFNDLMDIEEDSKADKTTEIMSLSPKGRSLVLAGIVIAMLTTISGLWINQFYQSATFCVMIWCLYTFYSAPLIRLKERGWWGVSAVALGEHCLPIAIAISLTHTMCGPTFPLAWLSAWLIGAFAFGCRSILWHQFCDLENDKRTKTKTLVAAGDPKKIKSIVGKVIFPIECGALLALVFMSGNLLSIYFLIAYAVLEFSRAKTMSLSLVIVEAKPKFRFLLLEYYQLFLPLSFLIAMVAGDKNATLLIIFQVCLFPQPGIILFQDTWHLLRGAIRTLHLLLWKVRQGYDTCHRLVWEVRKNYDTWKDLRRKSRENICLRQEVSVHSVRRNLRHQM